MFEERPEPGQAPTDLGLSVIVPALDEEEGIGQVLGTLVGVLSALGHPWEVLVIDDGSRDRTAEVASRQAGVTVIPHAVKRGYGAAIKTGLQRATYPCVIILDADGTYDPEDIPQLVKEASDHDMVVGARLGPGARIPLERRPAKWVVARLAEFLSGTKIPDLNSGLRLFRRDLALKFLGLLPSGFSLTTTLTLAFLTNDYSVKYVPIRYRRRIGHSKLNPVADTARLVQLLMRTVLYFNPLKIFMPISLLLFLLGLGIGLYSHFVLGRLMDVTTVVLLLSSLQVMMFALLADLIDKRLVR